MLKMNNPQMDFITYEVCKRLIPVDHLLVKINEIVDFSFIYDHLKTKYSDKGRGSKDPVMMFKILLLEYIYVLSDVQVSKRIMSDVAFRWFLGLNLDDPTPDDTTISHFRIHRLADKNLDEIFNKVVQMCIDKDIIKTNRFIVDTTDVAANVNYPSEKKLVRKAITKLAKEISVFDPTLGQSLLDGYQNGLDELYDGSTETIHSKKHFEIARKLIDELRTEIDEPLKSMGSLKDTYKLCLELIEDYLDGTKDRMISIVDKDARLAHKSAGNIKRGYKDQIIIDEDSEIILASLQTPFNVGDEKGLQALVNQVKENFKIKPKELSADKVYGTIENREFLDKKGIKANINFYNEREKENKCFGISDFVISNYLKNVTCPNGVVTRNFVVRVNEKANTQELVFKFDRKDCNVCPLREKCITKNKDGSIRGSRTIKFDTRYRTILKAKARAITDEFKEALNRRYIIERRFATMVRNHGLRRSRYIGMLCTSKHIIMANLACNIKRMVAILMPPDIVVPTT